MSTDNFAASRIIDRTAPAPALTSGSNSTVEQVGSLSSAANTQSNSESKSVSDFRDTHVPRPTTPAPFIMPVMPIATPRRGQDQFGPQAWFGLRLGHDADAESSYTGERERDGNERAGRMSTSNSQATVRSDAESEGTTGSTWNLFGGRDPDVSSFSSPSAHFFESHFI